MTKILVVDDSSTMRRIICNTLQQLGQEDTLQAADGVEALHVWEANPGIQLILTDWNMPNMNGLDFLLAVRQKTKDLPVVMITTEAEKASVIKAIQSGANNYIVKPFTPEVLREKTKQFLS